VRSTAGFNLQILFKTDILGIILNSFLYVHFFPLSFRRKKKETNQRKKKERVRSSTENSLKSRSEFWVVKKDATAIISTKMLAHASHFRDALSVFLLDLSF